jgi:hypothetical protein
MKLQVSVTDIGHELAARCGAGQHSHLVAVVVDGVVQFVTAGPSQPELVQLYVLNPVALGQALEGDALHLQQATAVAQGKLLRWTR